MDLPITDNDLETIDKPLALGGHARLYHLLKDVKEQKRMEIDLKTYEKGECDI